MKFYSILPSLLFIFYFSMQSFSQCSPDMSVTDPEGNGEIFPLDLVFKQNEVVSLDLTIIPPPKVLSGAYVVTLQKINLRDLQNKPSWMNYVSNATQVMSGNTSPNLGYEFVVGTKYCVHLSGTVPADAPVGTDSMGVMVDAYLPPAPGILLQENANGGHIRYTICTSTDNTCFPTFVEITEQTNFSLSEKNFTVLSKNSYIGFTADKPMYAELIVFDMLGRKIYNEKIFAETGDNKFQLNNNKFVDGAYIYSISNGKQRLNGRFIKSSKN